MIKKENLEPMLKSIGFTEGLRKKVLEKRYAQFNCSIVVDFNGNGSIHYPKDNGFKINRDTTCNFSVPENFVVLECVTRLMDKGYRPEHIELEKPWQLGHERKGGFADIVVKNENNATLFIIECKTFGSEYEKEKKNLKQDGGQLFSYWQQERNCKWLALYASDFDGNKVTYTTDSVNCSDDANILLASKKDTSILLYKNAHTVEELFEVWDETYDKRLSGDVIFRDDSQAYQIGVKPLRKIDLKDFSEEDGIVNKFEEILRHNNISDKENAFNRLIALFICKLVDEIQKSDNDVVEFQYKVGTDTYETLQDRLQRLHKEGMEKFMREEIFYVSDDYAENLIQQYTGQKRQKMIEDLKNTLRILKFYTNNDFAFKDVHNEELFYQNGKVLVEVVQLFENFRIIGSDDLQMLGDLFEQLLNKGFKQNEGQFFTPLPITRFIWDSLPLEKIIRKGDSIEYPKVIDYACGAGHFLTQGYESINTCMSSLIGNQSKSDGKWVEDKIYGIEKDYRLARVSKISLFMHGAGDGNIIFGDGLDNYRDKGITPNTFDILVANPPYSVKAFKPHLKLKDNELTIVDKISNEGSEIETLFVERVTQLVKPEGVVAVILPSSILNKENESFIGARETILENFNIKAIAQLGSKTFGATNTNTVILFLEKYAEPPKRLDLVSDSVSSIFNLNNLADWEDNDIFNAYLKKIGVDVSIYLSFMKREKDYIAWSNDEYFSMYYEQFINSNEYNKKVNQKSFEKLSNSEKYDWLNSHFYDYVSEIEREKLTYYALVYQQTTLIVVAPDENKAQEKFLGYKWSNRKGQEGIQISSKGGALYTDGNPRDKDKIAGIVRDTFYGKESSVDGLEDYTYHLRLEDMLNFSTTTFSKSLKTTKTRVLKTDVGLINYRLSDKKFSITIGDRVLSDEVEENGAIPIYSANVLEEFGRINKMNITDFSQPSVIWGVDSDWAVNVIPANVPFYPTDHCGVLRVNSDSIEPKYLALALEYEGRFERYSRYNRPSIRRIKSLTLQIPDDISKQNMFVANIEMIDEKIQQQLLKIADNDKSIQDKFEYMFGSKNYPAVLLPSIAEYHNGLTYHPEDESEEGTIVLRAGNIQQQKLDFNDIVRVTTPIKDSLYVRDDDILMCSNNGSAKLVGKVAIIKNLTERMTYGSFMTIIRSKYSRYLWAYFQTDDFRNQIKDGKTMSINNITAKMLDEIRVPMPNENELHEFSEYVLRIEKKTESAQEDISKLKKEREDMIDRHFQ